MQITLDSDNDDSYRPTPCAIKAQKNFKWFTIDKIKRRLTQFELSAQQLGATGQKKLTNNIDKMKIKQISGLD